MRSHTVVLPFILLMAACGGSAPEGAPPQTTGVQMPAPPAAEPPAAKVASFRVRGSVSTLLNDDGHSAVVELVLVDELGHPAAGVEVQGAFTDGIKERVVVTTNADGVATATARGGGQHMSVGFVVSGVSQRKGDARTAGKVLDDVIYPSPCCPLRTPPTQ